MQPARSRLLPFALLAFGLASPLAITQQEGLHPSRRSVRRAPVVKTDLPPIKVEFHDVAEAAGLVAPNVSGGRDAKKYLFETTGSGVALFDFDNDGLLDIYMANGTTLAGAGGSGDATGHLYRNRGGLRFDDVTERANLTRTGWGQGVCAADYNNDGFRDLLVTYYGRSVLYRNDGRSRFQDVTTSAGLARPGTHWDTGCTFVDYDRDGHLDLFIANYVAFDPATVPEPGARDTCRHKGIAVPCGPPGLPFAQHYLFRNRGDGTFADVSATSGVRTAAGCYGLTASASDFDNDGYPDLYVACDLSPSQLFRNLRNGRFEETGLLAGVALNEDGQTQAGMGLAVADYDENGTYDIAKTNFSDDVPNLYHNLGQLTFEDRVFETGIGAHMNVVGWGVHLLDVDHDGRRDLLMVNGHVYPQAEQRPGMSFKQPKLLYWNIGGRFVDISDRAGPAITERWSSRGSAAGDLDNDGSLEVVVSNMHDRPSLLRNTGQKKNWLLVECVGTTMNRDAIGARVWVELAGRRLSAEIQGGASYLSQNDPRAHFGLGDAARFDRIEVQWLGGRREVFPGGAGNRLVTLRQGTGKAP